MASISAVRGPKITGPRGTLWLDVVDLFGSISMVGCEARPAEVIEAWAKLLAVPGPALTKPPSMLPPITMALPASGLLPRALKMLVPIREIWPALTKEPPEDVGQVKPDGMVVSLAQEWMPPRVCTRIMPGPTPDRLDWRTKLPRKVPSKSIMTLLDAVELTLAV